MALTTPVLGTVCVLRTHQTLCSWSAWFMWHSLNLHTVETVWGDRGGHCWGCGSQSVPLTTDRGVGAVGTLGCHLGLCLCPENPQTPLTVPTSGCRTGTASVCPGFCSSQHSPVCLHTVPSAEQTAHGDSQQLAGRDSPGCVPNLPCSPHSRPCNKNTDPV